MGVFFKIVLYVVFLVALFYLTFQVVSKILQKKDNPGMSESAPPKERKPLTPKIKSAFKSFGDLKLSGFNKASSGGTITHCPYCDYKVPKGAWKCWHCKNRLPVSKSNIVASISLGFVFFLVFFILLISRYAGGSQSSSSLDPAIVVYDKQKG